MRPEDTAIGTTCRLVSFGVGALLVVLFAAQASEAQVPAPAPANGPRLEFETTSVKLHPMAPGTYLIKNFAHVPPFVIPTSNVFTDTAHVQDLVMEAYGLSGYQILYLPSWTLARDGYVWDIEGKAPGEGTPTSTQLQQMLQSLLADRFHLKTHWETKPKFSVNALVVDKGGPKVHEVQGNDGPGTTIFSLAHFLSQNLDFPVVDRTGLKEVAYGFSIDQLVNYHEMDREQGADPMAAQDYLRTEVQHQLGLRLEPRKESMQVLVIDHIEEPPLK